MTRQAVEDGLGIGIGPLPMLAIDIAAGKLTTPLPEIQVRRTGYVAVIPDHARRMPIAGVFIDWLADEGQRPSPANSGRQPVLEPGRPDLMT